jgi:cinnamyl-alcohol dehydrogenase
MPVKKTPAGSKTLAGSCIGGMRDTQEMIDVAAKHGVTADIEVVGADYVNAAMERLAKTDVRYRFVIDIGNTLKSSE